MFSFKKLFFSLEKIFGLLAEFWVVRGNHYLYVFLSVAQNVKNHKVQSFVKLKVQICSSKFFMTKILFSFDYC